MSAVAANEAAGRLLPLIRRYAWVGYFVLAFGVVLLLVVGAGGTPGDALYGWWKGAFGTQYNLVQTLAAAVPIAAVALGVEVGLRAGVISLGAQGQMIVATIALTFFALAVAPQLPAWLALPLGLLVAAAAGGLWALLPALAKVYWNVSEILFAILTNYLALYFLDWVLRNPLRDPAGAATPQSARLPEAFVIPLLPFDGRLHWGLVLVLAGAVVFFLWSRSRSAFVLGVFGSRPELAVRLGLSRARAIIGALVVAGAAAGVAGWMQLAGVNERLREGIDGGIGFTGMVAVLARGNPFGILLAAVLAASFVTGANGIQVESGSVPAAIGEVMQGVLLFAAALAIAYDSVRRRREGIGTKGAL
jgi:simple sugar transport system permease protein